MVRVGLGVSVGVGVAVGSSDGPSLTRGGCRSASRGAIRAGAAVLPDRPAKIGETRAAPRPKAASTAATMIAMPIGPGRQPRDRTGGGSSPNPGGAVHAAVRGSYAAGVPATPTPWVGGPAAQGVGAAQDSGSGSGVPGHVGSGTVARPGAHGRSGVLGRGFGTCFSLRVRPRPPDTARADATRIDSCQQDGNSWE